MKEIIRVYKWSRSEGRDVTIEADVGRMFFKEEGRSNWVKGYRQTPSDGKGKQTGVSKEFPKGK
jgi:hypothetical protein